jgi:hypothetical protein
VSSKLAVIVPLGITRTVAWASSYYLLAILAEPIAHDMHVASPAVFARLYGVAARSPITAIILMTGFASTVGWPLTAWSLDNLGWRETCLGWVPAHLLIGIPLNARLPNAEGLPAVVHPAQG